MLTSTFSMIRNSRCKMISGRSLRSTKRSFPSWSNKSSCWKVVAIYSLRKLRLSNETQTTKTSSSITWRDSFSKVRSISKPKNCSSSDLSRSLRTNTLQSRLIFVGGLVIWLCRQTHKPLILFSLEKWLLHKRQDNLLMSIVLAATLRRRAGNASLIVVSWQAPASHLFKMRNQWLSLCKFSEKSWQNASLRRLIQLSQIARFWLKVQAERNNLHHLFRKRKRQSRKLLISPSKPLL